MVASVPEVGNVTPVVPVKVKVDVNAPTVACVEEFAKDSVPLVGEIVSPFTVVGVIAPNVSVIAGVVVAVATLPETPFAVTTETEVTLPVPVPAPIAARNAGASPEKRLLVLNVNVPPLEMPKVPPLAAKSDEAELT